jgi:hypothetical protein
MLRDAMSITDIERAIEQLRPEDLAKFRSWFARYDAAQWDRQIEADATNGRLDELADEAIADLRDGRCKDL